MRLFSTYGSHLDDHKWTTRSWLDLLALALPQPLILTVLDIRSWPIHAVLITGVKGSDEDREN